MGNILTISKREITRLRTRFTGRSRLVVVAIVALSLIISYVIYHQSLTLSKDLYTVGVASDAFAITDERFNVIVLDYEMGNIMLQEKAIDLYIQGNEIISRSDERSQYTASALKQYLDHQELVRISNEYDIDTAFPLRIEVRHLKTINDEMGTEAPLSLSDILGKVEKPAASSDGDADVSGSLSHSAISRSDAAVEQQLGEFGDASNLPKFKAEFTSDEEILIPSLMTPPIPLAQVIIAFLYVIPIFFISVFFTSSFMEEKTNRKLVILLSTPATPFQIIMGKMLPYIGYSIVAIIAITLLLKGNVFLALAIFIPVMLFILSIYLMVALFYRTFKDQTFFSVLAVSIITAYLVAPAMFSGISDLSYISPLTLGVEMYRGESFGLTEYFISTTPMYLVFALTMFVGTRIFNEEYLMGFRPLYVKLSEAVFLSIDKSHLNISVFLLSLCFIPIVFMVQFASIIIASNLPMPLAMFALLSVGVIVEEIAKSTGIAVLLQNKSIKSLKSVVILSFLSALGFFTGEKLLLFLSMSVISESVFTAAIFGTGLIFIPLIVHFVATSVICIMTARFGTRYYPVAILAGSVIHILYNLYVVGAIL